MRECLTAERLGDPQRPEAERFDLAGRRLDGPRGGQVEEVPEADASEV
jgi:hypothetical protein